MSRQRLENAYEQGYADAHFIIPEPINNIDFGTGAYYIRHGNFNTSGYISFYFQQYQTKHSADRRWQINYLRIELIKLSSLKRNNKTN